MGQWNGAAEEGLVVRDTTGDGLFQYAPGEWLSL
jgi:hypothetical protein